MADSIHPTTLPRRRDISKIFIGNLSFETTEQDLAQFLAPAGPVAEVIIPADRASGRPRGFAFARFESDEAAEKAIELADGAELDGRTLRANPAEERSGGGRGGGFRNPDRPPGGGRGGPGKGKGGSRPKGSRRGVRSKKRSL